VRAFALAIAADLHPLQNLKVLNRLKAMGLDEETVAGWAREVNTEGLAACERLLADQPGPYCFGDEVTLADLCLVPQLGNARRFGVELSALPRLVEREAAAMQLDAFKTAAPASQPDAE
jgi:maleylpyruvate isomerase